MEVRVTWIDFCEWSLSFDFIDGRIVNPFGVAQYCYELGNRWEFHLGAF